MAQLYADLDGGFTHAAWLLPAWLPLPSFRYQEEDGSNLSTSSKPLLFCILSPLFFGFEAVPDIPINPYKDFVLFLTKLLTEVI